MPIIKDWGRNRPPTDELKITITTIAPPRMREILGKKPPVKEKVKPETEEVVLEITAEEDVPVL